MSNSAPSTRERLVPEITFGIAVMRGISALGVGLLLIFFPDKSGRMLANMMGFFWLFTGIALLRRSRDDSLVQMVGDRTTRIIAVIGALAGLLVVTRSLTRQVVPAGTFVVLLGVVIMLTGIIHFTADVRAGSSVSKRHRWLNLTLGIFEFILGLTLIVSPLDRSPATYWIGAIWGLIFGVMVITDAIATRSKERKAAKAKTLAGDAPPAAEASEAQQSEAGPESD